MNVCTHTEAGWRNFVFSIAFCLFIWDKLFPWTRDSHFLTSLEVSRPRSPLLWPHGEGYSPPWDAPAGFMAAEIQMPSAHDCAAGTVDASGLFSSVLRLSWYSFVFSVVWLPSMVNFISYTLEIFLKYMIYVLSRGRTVMAFHLLDISVVQYVYNYKVKHLSYRFYLHRWYLKYPEFTNVSQARVIIAIYTVKNFSSKSL